LRMTCHWSTKLRLCVNFCFSASSSSMRDALRRKESFILQRLQTSPIIYYVLCQAQIFTLRLRTSYFHRFEVCCSAARITDHALGGFFLPSVLPRLRTILPSSTSHFFKYLPWNKKSKNKHWRCQRRYLHTYIHVVSNAVFLTLAKAHGIHSSTPSPKIRNYYSYVHRYSTVKFTNLSFSLLCTAQHNWIKLCTISQSIYNWQFLQLSSTFETFFLQNSAQGSLRMCVHMYVAQSTIPVCT
jgi:hypothetical protein